MITPTQIGEAVRRSRKAMGLRQDEFAAAAGVGLRFIVELERGKPTIQIGRALAVLAAAWLDRRLVDRTTKTGATP